MEIDARRIPCLFLDHHRRNTYSKCRDITKSMATEASGNREMPNNVLADSQQVLKGQWFPKLMAEPGPCSSPGMLPSTSL